MLPLYLCACRKVLILLGPSYMNRMWCMLELFVLTSCLSCDLFGKTDVQVERMHLLQQVPVEFMRAYRDAQRADETYKHPNEKGIFYNVRKIDPFGNEDGISGLEWGSRKTVMRQRAANTKQEWKDKMNAEGRDEHGRVLERERE